MNKIEATIVDIQSIENLTIVAFESSEQQMQMMALGLNIAVKVGSKVVLGAKASNISLARNRSTMMSIANQLTCVVDSLKQGELLCSVKLRFNNAIIESIITMNSMKRMEIQVGDTIVALIKSSELSILEVEDNV